MKTAGQRQQENPGAGVDDAVLLQGMLHRGIPEVEALTQVMQMKADEYWDGDA